MKESIQLYIPEPCHENWQQMTPQDQGRFCNACAKVVVDFSVMSDKEILNYISTASSKICGRLEQDQLNREIIYPELQKKSWQKYWLTIAASFMLFTSRLSAQVKPSKGTITANPSSLNGLRGNVSITMGKVAIPQEQIQKTASIKGRVVDQNNLPIPGASIFIKGTTKGTVSDNNGNFHLSSIDQKKPILQISAVGFEAQELYIKNSSATDSIIRVEMKMQYAVLGEMIVVAKTKKKSFFNILKKTEPKCSQVNSAPAIKIYPNPITIGSVFNISLPGVLPGKYSIIIYDINGKVISQNDLNETKASSIIESFQCDSRFHSGVYVVKIVGEGKVYSQQFIVQ
jgi:hypothetical protein